MSRYILDARTAVPHFPGIGRYVTNLASALAPQLTAGEELSLLESPSAAEPAKASAHTWQAEEAFQLPGTTIIAPAAPFDIRQQWRIPSLLKRLRADGAALYHSPYYLMPYRTALPTLLTFYDIIPSSSPRPYPPAPGSSSAWPRPSPYALQTASSPFPTPLAMTLRATSASLHPESPSHLWPPVPATVLSRPPKSPAYAASTTCLKVSSSISASTSPTRICPPSSTPTPGLPRGTRPHSSSPVPGITATRNPNSTPPATSSATPSAS